MIVCFTDGSSRNDKSSNSDAAWAFAIPQDNILRSGKISGTNNQAELIAIRECVKFVLTVVSKVGQIPSCCIISDSDYAIKALTGDFKSKKNYDLVNEILDLINGIEWIGLKHINTVEVENRKSFGIFLDMVDKEAKRILGNNTGRNYFKKL